MMMPCSSAGPSRGGPLRRSRPCAAALAASRAMLASHWSRVMYPGWAPGMKEVHSSRGTVMLEAVLVADQGAGHGADFEELMPVGVVAGQPRAFQAQHDPGPAEGHFGDQLLEPFAVGGAGSGLALVDVDHGDLVRRPAQRDRFA